MTLIQGDSTVNRAYYQLGFNEKMREEERADILITDPPYCLLERRRASGALRDEKNRKRKTEYQEEVPRFENFSAYRSFTDKWLQHCLSLGLKQNAPLIMWTNPLGKSILIDVAKENNYCLLGEYQWAKRTSKKDSLSELSLRVYENALIFFRQSSRSDTSNTNVSHYYLDKEDVFLKTKRMKLYEIPFSIISDYAQDESTSSFSRSYSSPQSHPCYKPEHVLKPLVATWTEPGDRILDPFAGSGSLMRTVQAVGQGREYYGIEILDKWTQRSTAVESLA